MLGWWIARNLPGTAWTEMYLVLMGFSSARQPLFLSFVAAGRAFSCVRLCDPARGKVRRAMIFARCSTDAGIRTRRVPLRTRADARRSFHTHPGWGHRRSSGAPPTCSAGRRTGAHGDRSAASHTIPTVAVTWHSTALELCSADRWPCRRAAPTKCHRRSNLPGDPVEARDRQGRRNQDTAQRRPPHVLAWGRGDRHPCRRGRHT